MDSSLEEFSRKILSKFGILSITSIVTFLLAMSSLIMGIKNNSRALMYMGTGVIILTVIIEIILTILGVALFILGIMNLARGNMYYGVIGTSIGAFVILSVISSIVRFNSLQNNEYFRDLLSTSEL